jgi:hypothetical protein
VQQVRRYIKSNNLILLIVLLELKQVIALVAVNNKQIIVSYSPLLCISVKVL